MEGLLNYSSDDDQEEFKSRIAAERGNHAQSRRSNNLGSSSCTSAPHPPSFAARDGNADGRNGAYREEEKHKRSSTSSGSRSRVRESHPILRSKSKERRDARDDTKEYGHDNYKSESKRYRTKDHKIDHKRVNKSDNSRSVRKYSRDDERRQHHSERKCDRMERSRHGESSSSSSHRHSSHSRRRGSPDKRFNRSADRHRQRETRNYRQRNSRSRSRSVSHSRDHLVRPLDKARLSALEMERKLNFSDSPKSVEMQQIEKQQPTRTIVPLMSLPLSDIAPKQPNLIAVANILPNNAVNNVEPQVIQLPSYYNPSVINPSKYAEQQQKRKLLWGAKKAEDTAAKWGNAHFSQDSDGKVASKFMRLMGIKGGSGVSGGGDAAAAAAAAAANANAANDADADADANKSPSALPLDIQKREAMFSKMEQQYEVARQVTHTMRGVGLGFSSQPRSF